MSVWGNINRLVQGTQDWLKDVGLMTIAGPKFLWDIGTAPWNDREEFNGVANSLRQAGIDKQKCSLGTIDCSRCCRRNC